MIVAYRQRLQIMKKSDPTESKHVWADEPHFDPMRTNIEALINNASESGYAAQMRAALEERNGGDADLQRPLSRVVEDCRTGVGRC